jgi:hypothetical protein
LFKPFSRLDARRWSESGWGDENPSDFQLYFSPVGLVYGTRNYSASLTLERRVGVGEGLRHFSEQISFPLVDTTRYQFVIRDFKNIFPLRFGCSHDFQITQIDLHVTSCARASDETPSRAQHANHLFSFLVVRPSFADRFLRRASSGMFECHVDALTHHQKPDPPKAVKL